MKSATDNADELIKNLSRIMNRLERIKVHLRYDCNVSRVTRLHHDVCSQQLHETADGPRLVRVVLRQPLLSSDIEHGVRLRVDVWKLGTVDAAGHRRGRG